MKHRARQSGALLFAAIVLIVIVAATVTVLAYLNAGSLGSSALHDDSEKAFFAARAGIEYAASQTYNGAGCAALNGSQPVGNGTFNLAATLYAPAAPVATNAVMTAASPTVSVPSTAGYAPYGRILVDSELINYTSTTATAFNGLTRGAGGTVAAGHAVGATVSQNLCGLVSTGTLGNPVRATRIVQGSVGAGATAPPGAMGTMGADAMVVYAQGTAVTGGGSNRNIYYRLWDAAANTWGAEQTIPNGVGANSSPVYFSVQFARTRNEAVMGVLDGNRRLYIHVWNGRLWSNPGGLLATASTNTARTFQIAYEYAGDRAIIVYQNGTRNPQYAIWNGTALALAGNVWPGPGPNYPVQNAGTRHFWFRLAPRNVAGSNDILMLSSDSNRHVYGLRWTGVAWNNMGTTVRWDQSTGTAANRETIDVAWQADGTLAVFAWADSSATRQLAFKTWTAATLTLNPAGAVNTTRRLNFPAFYANQNFEWLRLYPAPNNNMLAMLQTPNNAAPPRLPSLLSTVWAGGTFSIAFPPVTGHDNNAVENSASPATVQSRSFDFAWEKLPAASGRGWLLWGSQGGGGIRTRYFTAATSTWGAVSPAIRQRTLLVQAGAMSPSGRLVAGAYRSAGLAVPNRITESVTTTGGGTAWPNAATQLWAGPTTIPQGERVFVMTREGARINSGVAGTGAVGVLRLQESTN